MKPDEFRKRIGSTTSVLELAQLTATEAGGLEGFVGNCDEAAGALRARARVVAERCLEGVLTRVGPGALKSVVDLVSTPEDVAPVARGLFKALDSKCGDKVMTAFLSSEEVVDLKPGLVFPIARVNLKELMPGRSFKPESLGEEITSLKYLGIARSASTMRVTMDFRTCVLPSGSGDMRVCAIVASPKDEEFDWNTGTHEEKESFFGVRIKHRERYAKRLLAALQTASSYRASVVVLPELSVWEELTAKLHDWFQGSDLAGMVCGSAHLPSTAKVGINQSAFFAGTSTLTHDKFNKFVLKKWNGKKVDPELTEALRRDSRRGFTVNFANGVSFVFVVCKDALDPEFLTELREVRPTYLFVASMSPDLDEFATQLPSLGQTMSFVTNFTQADGPIALAVLPTKEAEGRIKKSSRSKDAQAPEIRLFSLRSNTLEWNSLSLRSVSD